MFNFLFLHDLVLPVAQEYWINFHHPRYSSQLSPNVQKHDEALRHACLLYRLQAVQLFNHYYLHTKRLPQPFLKLKNIVVSNSSGADGNNVVVGSSVPFSNTQPHSYNSKSFPTQN